MKDFRKGWVLEFVQGWACTTMLSFKVRDPKMRLWSLFIFLVCLRLVLTDARLETSRQQTVINTAKDRTINHDVGADLAKLTAVNEFLTPVSAHDVLSFLGLTITGALSKISKILCYLNYLLNVHSPFYWPEECQNVLDTLKKPPQPAPQFGFRFWSSIFKKSLYCNLYNHFMALKQTKFRSYCFFIFSSKILSSAVIF